MYSVIHNICISMYYITQMPTQKKSTPAEKPVEPVPAKPAPKRKIGKKEFVPTLAEKSGLPSVESKMNEIRLVIETANPPMPPSAPIKPPRAKRVLTDEQKEVLRERLAKAREARAAKKLVA